MKVIWESPANIALVKYWGKYGSQMPANPSVSMTLHQSKTTTEVSLDEGLSPGKWQYTYSGIRKPLFEPKLKSFFNLALAHLPGLSKVGISINSSNNFPHSSGISSSASFFSSLALGLCELEKELSKTNQSIDEFYQKASFLARLGSGSASRSVYPNYAIWGECAYPQSSDQFAIPLSANTIHPVFRTYKDAILIVSSSPKPMSSSLGHKLMDDNPYSKVRYEEARKNLSLILEAIKYGDQVKYIEIVEHEAQTLHGLILSSINGSILLEPGTLEIIQRVKKFRKDTGSNCCFTLDAGPNIHLLYPESESNTVEVFIESELKPFCEDGKWIRDSIGSGPEKK